MLGVEAGRLLDQQLLYSRLADEHGDAAAAQNTRYGDGLEEAWVRLKLQPPA